MWHKHEPFARVRTRLLKHANSDFRIPIPSASNNAMVTARPLTTRRPPVAVRMDCLGRPRSA
jgi:hypothetical protein